MNDDNLDLLDLDDADSVDTLPEAPVFAAPRPKKPWLLLTVGLVAIVLATYVIIRTVSDDSSSMDVNLDVPVAVVDANGVPVDMNVMPQPKPQPVVAPQPAPVPAQPVAAQPKPQPVAQPVQETPGVPVRVIEERKEVKFEPAKAAQPAAKKVVKPQPKPVTKPVAKPATYSWYVQFGSYSTRALAESAQKKIASTHRSLFDGKQFVILAAQLQNGTTTYRLRVGFNSANDANGFCRNAKSDGLDCYVAK